MQYGTSLTIGAALALLLAGCGQGEKQAANIPAAPEPAAQGVQDYPVKLGAPYKIGNASYTPEDVALYDEVGYASWYGAELEGRPTANGETFVSGGVSAAHKTLPMPSYAEVTSLDTGRTIIVRINDRGPFANDRLIDLSDGAARQLGITGQGVAGVRVRRVNPPEQDKAALRSGVAAPTRMDTPESLLKVLREKLGKLPRPRRRSLSKRCVRQMRKKQQLRPGPTVVLSGRVAGLPRQEQLPLRHPLSPPLRRATMWCRWAPLLRHRAQRHWPARSMQKLKPAPMAAFIASALAHLPARVRRKPHSTASASGAIHRQGCCANSFHWRSASRPVNRLACATFLPVC
jgi:rare lipoprotein A (peptidoglycan hydrolase)